MNKLLKIVLLTVTYFHCASITFASNKLTILESQPIGLDTILQDHRNAPEALDADQRFFYIGAEFGAAIPVKQRFKHKPTNSDLTINNSLMYGGNLGYSFYPQMAIEFSASRKDKYKLVITPDVPGIPKTSVKTKASAETYMINVVYSLQNLETVTPFIIFGAGLSRVKVNPVPLFNGATKIMQFNKAHTNCFAWQVGLGVEKAVTDNFALVASMKFHATHNAKIQYQALDTGTGLLTSKPAIKKHIGVGELGIGFKYKFPV